MTAYQPEKQTTQAATIEAPINPNGSITSRLGGIPLSRTSSVSGESAVLQKNKPKIGILGLGSIGKRHLKNFSELGCPVLGYDPEVSVSKISLSRHELIAWADAIVVATPTDHHYTDITLCNPLKPLFVEKPIVATRNQLSIPTKNNIQMVGYNLRFHSCVKKAREWLGTGAIGKPLWARFTCAQYNDKPSYMRDGVILNWSHEIDLALHLLGDAVVMGCMQTRSHENSEYIADILLMHGNTQCQTVVHLDYLTRFERRGFIIVGAYGSIDGDLVGRQAILRENSGRIIENFGGRDSFDGNYLDEARCFLKRLEGEETLGCTAAEAIKVVDICLQAKEYVRGR